MAAAVSKIHFSYEGIGEMLRSPWMEAHMLSRANRMKDYAEAIAPVYRPNRRNRWKDTHIGRYKDSFSTSSSNHGGYRHDRAAGFLTNDSPEAVFVEFGASHDAVRGTHQRGQHIMREAMISGATG